MLLERGPCTSRAAVKLNQPFGYRRQIQTIRSKRCVDDGAPPANLAHVVKALTAASDLRGNIIRNRQIAKLAEHLATRNGVSILSAQKTLHVVVAVVELCFIPSKTLEHTRGRPGRRYELRDAASLTTALVRPESLVEGA